MRVLHVIDSGGLYGAEVMLLNLAEEQIKQGIQPVIASISEPSCPEKAIDQEASARGIPLRRCTMKPGLNVTGARFLAKTAQQEQVDVIHSHGYKGNILFGILPRKVRRLPVVSTIHGYTSIRLLSKMRVYEMVDRLMLRRCDAVVLVNAQMSENSRNKRVRHRNLQVIDNGIPIDPKPPSAFTSQEEKEIEDFCEEGFIVGSVGRYSAEKGYELLISAIARLAHSGVNVKLVLIGDGPKRAELEGLVRQYHVESKVLLSGYQSDAARFLPLMNLYVISSYTEGLPITLLEAMRAGIPVIATRVGGIPEVLEKGRCGTLIKSGSENHLYQAVSQSMKCKNECDQMAKRARERMRAKYSVGGMAEKYFQLYQSITFCGKG